MRPPSSGDGYWEGTLRHAGLIGRGPLHVTPDRGRFFWAGRHARPIFLRLVATLNTLLRPPLECAFSCSRDGDRPSHSRRPAFRPNDDTANVEVAASGRLHPAWEVSHRCRVVASCTGWSS